MKLDNLSTTDQTLRYHLSVLFITLAPISINVKET